MIDIGNWNWVSDLGKMICYNKENEVTVKIYTEGKIIRGKILDLSLDLYREIAMLSNGPQIVHRIIMAAEDEFWKASLNIKDKPPNGLAYSLGNSQAISRTPLVNQP